MWTIMQLYFTWKDSFKIEATVDSDGWMRNRKLQELNFERKASQY
jgi:hypothetical protein